MEKTRILHIVQSAGGVDRYIRMLLKYMNNEQFENVIICSYDFHKRNYIGLVIAFEYVEMQRTIGLGDFKSIISVRRLIKKYKPDIVYVHSSKAGAIGRIANIGIKNHCFYNPHGWAFKMRCSKKKQMMYTVIEKMLVPLCEKIICISESEKRDAVEKNICKEKKTQVIFNGIDIEAYKSRIRNEIKRSYLKISEEAFVVGMVGRITQQKAPDIFIRAAKTIKHEIPNAFFIIVGSGEQENEIRKFAKNNGLENSLYITGWVDNPLSYVELFDVASLLSRWEGFGLVLPEYMMCEKPIVATDVDAIPNIIQNDINGILVPADNAEAVSSAVIRIYRNQLLKKTLVKNGIADVYKKFDASRVSREHEELWNKLVK